MPEFGLSPVLEKTTPIILSGFPEGIPALLIPLLRLHAQINTQLVLFPNKNPHEIIGISSGKDTVTCKLRDRRRGNCEARHP